MSEEQQINDDSNEPTAKSTPIQQEWEFFHRACCPDAPDQESLRFVFESGAASMFNLMLEALDSPKAEDFEEAMLAIWQEFMDRVQYWEGRTPDLHRGLNGIPITPSAMA